MKPTVVVVVFTMMLFVLSGAGAATKSEKGSKGGAMANVGFDLARVYDEHESYLAAVRPRVFKSSNRLLRIVDERVVIDAVAAGDAHTLKTELEALGLQKGSAFGSMVSGWLPIAAVDKLAALKSLKFARPAYATTNVGLATSQGDAAMRADDARASFGVDGTGVTVGTLSDSFDCLGSAAADVASGDLPPGITVLDDTACPGSDEGRAMMQLIHDVAPGASQSFHTAFNGQADFAFGIIQLALAGADVIVDDVIYLAEPMFQDGLIAQAVDIVKGSGVSYFSAAGNQSRDAYEHSFAPNSVFPAGNFPSVFGAPTFFGGVAHDFDPGAGVDVFQSITVPAGSGFFISLQWDSPFFSVSGPPGSLNDLDIYILDDPATTVLAGSIEDNISGSGDPVEILVFFNPIGSEQTQFNIMILNFFGAAPDLMKYVRFDLGPVGIPQFDTASGTVYGHANAAGAEAVGAAFYGETPEFGVDPALLEPFSSAGPTPILFTLNGTPTFEQRQKPEIVGPDGTNTTFFGQDVEPDGFPNFFGTSAAAPHAAAVAALLKDAEPTLDPDSVYTTLETTAADMGVAGVDFDSGFGFIQADLAVAKVVAPVIITHRCRGKPATIVGTRHGDFLIGTPGDDVIVGLAGNDVIFGRGGDDIICGNRGHDILFGMRGNDTLVGGRGRDILLGQRGNDMLDGGPGRDPFCHGGPGTDTAVNCERVFQVP